MGLHHIVCEAGSNGHAGESVKSSGRLDFVRRSILL